MSWITELVGTIVGTKAVCYLLQKTHTKPNHAMSVTLKLYAINRKKKKNGEVPIYLRITKNQKYRYVSTGVSIDPKFWNETTCQVRRSHPRSPSLNQELEDFVDTVKKTITGDKGAQTVFSVKERLVNRQKVSFFTYAHNFAERLAKEDNYFEWGQSVVLINQLETFLGTRNIEFEDLDSRKVLEFRKYLVDVVENGTNTVNKKMKRLRRIFTNARKEGETGIDPFQGYKAFPEVKSDRLRLSIAQINGISALDLEVNSQLWHTRNVFMFSFYNSGIRFGDLCRLRWANLVDGYIVYRMSKTGVTKKIKVTKPVRAILDLYKSAVHKKDDYIFPLLKDPSLKGLELMRQISSKNVIANQYLKRIASLANIEGVVTFHVARHSFADFARVSEMTVYNISKALGHSNLKETQQYLASIDYYSLDAFMEKLFGVDEVKESA